MQEEAKPLICAKSLAAAMEMYIPSVVLLAGATAVIVVLMLAFAYRRF